MQWNCRSRLLFYLFGNYLNTATTGLARVNAKEREKKERKGRRAKKRKGIETQDETPNPIPGNWWSHRGWRAERKTEENKKKETGIRPTTQLSWTVQSTPYKIFPLNPVNSVISLFHYLLLWYESFHQLPLFPRYFVFRCPRASLLLILLKCGSEHILYSYRKGCSMKYNLIIWKYIIHEHLQNFS